MMENSDLVFNEFERAEIKKIKEEGFFDLVNGVCENRDGAIWLNNPFDEEEQYQKFLVSNQTSLPLWISRSTSLIEFYSVLLELQGLLNGLNEEGRLKDFLAEYTRS